MSNARNIAILDSLPDGTVTTTWVRDLYCIAGRKILTTHGRLVLLQGYSANDSKVVVRCHLESTVRDHLTEALRHVHAPWSTLPLLIHLVKTAQA